MKLSKKEIEEAYLARLESETRQPETEEQRKLAKEGSTQEFINRLVQIFNMIIFSISNYISLQIVFQ